MEDGIESLLSTFSEKLTHKDVKIVSNPQTRDKLYLYIPKTDGIMMTNNIISNNIISNCIISNCILFDNIEKIMEHSKQNDGQIAIFTKDPTGTYKFSNLQ